MSASKFLPPSLVIDNDIERSIALTALAQQQAARLLALYNRRIVESIAPALPVADDPDEDVIALLGLVETSFPAASWRAHLSERRRHSYRGVSNRINAFKTPAELLRPLPDEHASKLDRANNVLEHSRQAHGVV